MTGEPTSAQERTEWLRLAEGATEGPWYTEKFGDFHDPAWHIAGIIRDRYGDNALSCGSDEATAAFIAVARTALPRLVADVERLTATLAAVRDQVDHTISNPAWTDDLTPAEARLAVAYAIRHVMGADHGSPDRERETGGRP